MCLGGLGWRSPVLMVRVIGHRGAAGLEPENTLRSVRRAILLGVDEVEIDIRVSKDGFPVVIHDETVDRTTDGHGYVRDLTLNEIKNLDAGKGEHIPTLGEILDLTQGKVILQIELKVPEALKPVMEVIKRRSAEEDVVITSFIHRLLADVYRINPRVATGAIFSRVQEDVFKRVIGVHARWAYINYRNVDAGLIREAHERGLMFGVWTVDQVDDMRRMVGLGVDAIGTNRPDILIRLLKSMGTP